MIILPSNVRPYTKERSFLGLREKKVTENGKPNFDQPSFQRKILIKRDNVKKLIQAHPGEN